MESYTRITKNLDIDHLVFNFLLIHILMVVDDFCQQTK